MENNLVDQKQREIEEWQQRYNSLEEKIVKILAENTELKLCIKNLALSINAIVRD